MTAMPLSLTLANIDFAALPKIVREEVTLLDRHLKQCLASPKKMVAYVEAARQLTAAGQRYSASGVRNLCAVYKAGGCDWRTLVDWRKVPHDENRLPAAFVDEFKRRSGRHGRSAAQARLDLLADWRRGVPIPGYPDHPKADPTKGHPAGWSYANLLRVAKVPDFEKIAQRVGLGAAKAKHGPKLFTTRAGLWPLSHILPDDVDHDVELRLLARNQQCRASNLGMYDLLSGNYFKYATKPLFKRFDPKLDRHVTDKWKEANMRYLVACQLTEIGYNPRGTQYVVELGTATLRDRVVALLHDRSKAIHGEAVLTVDHSGTTGKEQILEGMHRGEGGGNPRHKAALESLHNLMHNAMGALPGQTGPDVARRPEQLAGMMNATDELMLIARALTPWAREKLKFPTLEYHSEFLPILREIINAINRRTEHNLEGWAKCDFFTNEFRWHRGSEEWISGDAYLALPNETRALLAQIVQTDLACQRPRRMSPHEVFEKGRSQLVKAPAGLVAELLYDDLAVEHKCRNGYFELHDVEIDPEVLRYDSRVYTPDGRIEELTPDTYEVVINPFQPDFLWVYNGKRGRGGFLGVAHRTLKPCRADATGKGTALAILRERFDDLAAPVRARGRDLAREEQARLQHNLDVITGPGSAEEARVIEHRRAPAGDDSLADLGAAAPATAPDPGGSLDELI